MKRLTTIFTTLFLSLGLFNYFSDGRLANQLHPFSFPNCSCEKSLSTSANSETLEYELRQEIEAQILRSTARIVIQTWEMADNEAGFIVHEGSGHATVNNGRFLVTHNHFEVPFSVGPDAAESPYYSRFLLFDAFGNLKHEGPASEFFVAAEAAEALVFGHQETNFLASLGFSSAEFISWDQLDLAANPTVAQIDWDGENTRVDWATLDNPLVEGGVPQTFLADGALRGASGGGVFWQGQHIGNNWAVRQIMDSQGNILSERTRVALNPAEVVVIG